MARLIDACELREKLIALQYLQEYRNEACQMCIEHAVRITDHAKTIALDTPKYIPTPNSSRLLTFDETLDWIRTGQPYYLENNPDVSETWHSMLNYGRVWRCWNTEPSKEQMERTPWNS